MTDDQKQSLAGFVAATSAGSALRIEEDLGSGFVRLLVSEAERRQAKQDIRCVEDALLELLRNARDAHATRIYVATGRSGGQRRLVVLDDGDGIPAHLHQRIFEPRVTSKLQTMHMDNWGVHGRGMALYSISQNAQSCRICASASGLGTALEVLFNCASIPEKSDQFSWPELERLTLLPDGPSRDSTASATEVQIPGKLRGPHNIARCVVEFALSCPDHLRVYLGSVADIVATLQAPADVLADGYMPADSGAHAPDSSAGPALRPLVDRLRSVYGAHDLMQTAAELGLDISERTAHRITAGEIQALSPVLLRYTQTPDGSCCDAAATSSSTVHGGTASGTAVSMSAGKTTASTSESQATDPLELSSRLTRDLRSLRIDSGDAAVFLGSLAQSFEDLARRYYLEAAGEPQLRIQADKIVVSFPYRKSD